MTAEWGDTARPKPHQGRRACRGNEAEREIIRAQPLFHISAEDGFHTFWWFFVDYKGYISPQESVVFNIDRTPPMINFTREKIEENKIKFTANVSDETSGVDIVDFYVDGDFEANFSSPPYEWIYTGSGRHTVTAVVYDKAGNSNSSSLSTWHSKSGQQTVSIPNSQNVMSVIPIVERANYVDDTTPPVTTITFDPPEPDGLCGWYVSNVTIIMNATDDISGVNKIYYSINSEPWQVYDEPILLHQNGVFNIVYFSIDNAGNIEFPKLSYLKIDQTPPEIEFTYVWSGKKPPYTFTYIINAIDTTSGIIRVDLYLNAELQYTFFEPGPYIYIIWEIQWVPVPKSIFRAIAYNFAGLSTYDDIIDPKLSKNRIINAPFLSFLQNFIQSHPNLFPILQKLLQSLLLQ
jgi:hypothetical protein